MDENTVNVQGNANNSDELSNLYLLARRFKDADNGENAIKYYDMILLKDPNSWEATFYVVYFKAKECKIAEIESAAISVTNCIDTILTLIKNNVSDHNEQVKAYCEVYTRVVEITSMLYSSANSHYKSIDFSIRNNYTQEWVNRSFAAIRCIYRLGDSLDTLFGNFSDSHILTLDAWEKGINWHKSLIPSLQNKEGNKREIDSYVAKVKKYNSSYVGPFTNNTNITSSNTSSNTSDFITGLIVCLAIVAGVIILFVNL